MKENFQIFRTSNVFFGLALILFAASLFYGIFQGRIWLAEKNAIEDNYSRLERLDTQLLDTKKQYEAVAEQSAEDQEGLTRKIMNILPPDENYTDLTRELDKYFEENDTAANPIFQSSLRFGKGASVQDARDVSSLPFSMNIESTRDNFFKFLEYVNDSGSLESGARLMEINSIQLNFPQEGEDVRDPRQKINFTVDMNAYYKTPKVAR